MEFSGNNNNSSQNNSSGICSDQDTDAVNVMKKGGNSCNKGFVAMDSQQPPHYPRQDGGSRGHYRAVGAVGMNYSSLVRQNSSPAGLFSQHNLQNGYTRSRLFESHGVAEGCSTRYSNSMNFSSLGLMFPRISEVKHESDGSTTPNEPKVENNSGENPLSSFGSWIDDYSYDTESFTRRKMIDDRALFVSSQIGEPHMLSHPEAAAEVGAMHFQDTVPCKVRAKRGCATHPRSVAERLRRTRISDRMRKLQDIVPTMDKQTNIADMLDFAVDYIKGLQKQYKALSDLREKCKCSAFSESVPKSSSTLSLKNSY